MPNPCQHPGCVEPDTDVYGVWDDAPRWYCPVHAGRHGWCWGCKRAVGARAVFTWGNPSGLCADCQETLQAEDDRWLEEDPS